MSAPFIVKESCDGRRSNDTSELQELDLSDAINTIFG